MRGTLRIAVALMLLAVVGTARAGSEDEVKALFARFIAAQNAHDLKAVGELLQDSPQFLWMFLAVLMAIERLQIDHALDQNVRKVFLDATAVLEAHFGELVGSLGRYSVLKPVLDAMRFIGGAPVPDPRILDDIKSGYSAARIGYEYAWERRRVYLASSKYSHPN